MVSLADDRDDQTYERQGLDRLRVAHSRIYVGDMRWYIQNAAGHVVRGPFVVREEAEDSLMDLRLKAADDDYDPED